MAQNESQEPSQLVSTDTKITAVFVILAVVLWYGSTRVTENQLVQFVLLLVVGIIVPTLLNELR